MEFGRFLEALTCKVWWLDESQPGRPVDERYGAHLWCQEMPRWEQACFHGLHAHKRGWALVGQYEVSYGRETLGDHLRGLQEEVFVWVLPRQREIRKGVGIPPTDAGKQVCSRVCREIQASGTLLHHAARWGVALQEVWEWSQRRHSLNGSPAFHQELCRLGGKG